MVFLPLRSYTPGNTSRLMQYLTHDARHLAVEINRSGNIASEIALMNAPATSNQRRCTITQLVASVAENEHTNADTLFAATRAMLEDMALDDRAFIMVAHGPPEDSHLHVHVLLPLASDMTGEVHPLARLHRDAWEAARRVAPRFGLEAPPMDDGVRRREPRAARSVGVWHGERSLYAWLAERVGPTLVPAIQNAGSATEVAALLANYGLRYARNTRGGILEDWSSDPPRRVPASALAFTASAPALEARFGPLPAFPIPADARRNPQAYANDHDGRRLPLGSAAERRAFAGDHATWRTVWLPVRESRLREQRDVEKSRRQELAAEISGMRAVGAEVAQTREERRAAADFVADYAREARRNNAQLREFERGALRALPFASPPPSRLLEWIRTRNAAPADPPRLCAPTTWTPPDTLTTSPPISRLETGIAGGIEWWRGSRRVVIDDGDVLHVADPAALDEAVAVARDRWGTLRIAGDPDFRERAERAARAAAATYGFLAPPVPFEIPLPNVNAVARIRAATAVASHLGLREIELDGVPLSLNRPDRHPAAQITTNDAPPATVRIPPTRAIVLKADGATQAAMLRAGYEPAIATNNEVVIALDPHSTAEEVDVVARRFIDTYRTQRSATLTLDGHLQYGPTGPPAALLRLLQTLRPQTRAATFAERVDAIDRFLRGLEPKPDAPAIVLPPPEREERITQTRKRGSRTR